MPQFFDFSSQLIHFAASVVAAFLLVTSPLVVVAMGSSLHLLGDVMHARGMEMFDGDHEVLHLFFHVTIAFVTLPLAVTTLSLVMKMIYFLSQLVFQTLGFLTAVVLAQVMDAAFLFVYPSLEPFAFFFIAFAMFHLRPLVPFSLLVPAVAQSFFHDASRFRLQFPSFLVLARLS
jgi:hypothetical protein